MIKNLAKNIFWLWILILLTAPIIVPAIQGYKQAAHDHQEQQK